MEKSILVIDDEFDLRENIKEILIESGYKVEATSNTQKAMEHLRKSIPDVIISDIIMPGINGLEFLALLKNDKTLSNIPFIFLSARSTYDDYRKGMRIGADDYLYKPFKAHDLLDAVKSKLEKVNKMNTILNDLKENIALSVPHEFRTPLTPIIGLSDLMMGNGENFSKEEIEKMSYSINANAKRLHSRIEKFLLLANIYTELNELSRQKSTRDFLTSDLNEIVNQIILEESQIFGRKDKIIFNITESILKIDEYYFTICIKELVENALKFCGPLKKIIINGENRDNFYQLSFTNDGKGMTPEQIKNIDLFNKHNEGIKEGSGIGLTVVKKIIEHFNGELIIESKPNIQTIVSLKLPVAKNNYRIENRSA